VISVPNCMINAIIIFMVFLSECLGIDRPTMSSVSLLDLKHKTSGIICGFGVRFRLKKNNHQPC
jgi:hypothetical protein